MAWGRRIARYFIRCRARYQLGSSPPRSVASSGSSPARWATAIWPSAYPPLVVHRSGSLSAGATVDRAEQFDREHRGPPDGKQETSPLFISNPARGPGPWARRNGGDGFIQRPGSEHRPLRSSPSCAGIAHSSCHWTCPSKTPNDAGASSPALTSLFPPGFKLTNFRLDRRGRAWCRERSTARNRVESQTSLG